MAGLQCQTCASRRASCRACHNLLRSVVSVAQRKPLPSKPRAISSVCCACSATLALVPWNSKNKVGAWPQAVQLRVTDAGLDLNLVEQLHAGNRNASLHDGNHRFDRVAQCGNWAGGGRHGLGDAVQAQLDLGDDAQGALGADEKPGQIVAGGGDLRTRPPVRITRPSGRTTVRPIAFSRMVP